MLKSYAVCEQTCGNSRRKPSTGERGICGWKDFTRHPTYLVNMIIRPADLKFEMWYKNSRQSELLDISWEFGGNVPRGVHIDQVQTSPRSSRVNVFRWLNTHKFPEQAFAEPPTLALEIPDLQHHWAFRGPLCGLALVLFCHISSETRIVGEILTVESNKLCPSPVRCSKRLVEPKEQIAYWGRIHWTETIPLADSVTLTCNLLFFWPEQLSSVLCWRWGSNAYVCTMTYVQTDEWQPMIVTSHRMRFSNIIDDQICRLKARASGWSLVSRRPLNGRLDAMTILVEWGRE